jgi:hypothetical protein
MLLKFISYLTWLEYPFAFWRFVYFSSDGYHEFFFSNQRFTICKYLIYKFFFVNFQENSVKCFFSHYQISISPEELISKIGFFTFWANLSCSFPFFFIISFIVLHCRIFFNHQLSNITWGFVFNL